MEPKLPTPQGEVDVAKYWRLHGRLASLRAAISDAGDRYRDGREALARAEQRAARQADEWRRHPGNRNANDSVGRADSNLQAEQDGIARLRADLSRIEVERAALNAKREPLGALVQRCEAYLKGLGLLPAPAGRVEMPARRTA